MARTCIYCGGTPLNREHALPDWLKENTPHVGDLRDYEVTRGVVGGPTKKLDSNPYELKVRAVCEKCNHGWMSDLESTAKPWLLSLLHQREREIPPFALALIAAWVFKTYRMMHLANRAPNERDPVPHEHDRVLYEQGVPPSAVSIFIGNSVLSPNRPLFRPGWHPDVILWRPDEPPFNQTSGPASVQGDIYGATLGIGHFVTELVGNTFAGGLTLLNIQPPAVIADRMIRIWPIAAGIGPGGPITWPPAPLNDDEVFAAAAGLMEWFRNLPLGPDDVRKRHPPKGLT